MGINAFTDQKSGNYGDSAGYYYQQLDAATQSRIGDLLANMVFGSETDIAGFGHGAMENVGLNVFNEEAAFQRERELVRAELTTEYNNAISRFGKGAGSDITAPNKASFRHVSRSRSME